MRARGGTFCPSRPERASLIEWAIQSGKILAPGCLAEFHPVGTGAEHSVFHDWDNGLAIKVTHPNRFGHSACEVGKGATPLEYLRRLRWHNALFGDRIRVQGLIYDEEVLQVVTQQPWITTGSRRLPNQREIDFYFGQLGFEFIPLFPNAPLYFSKLFRLVVADAHDRNMLIDENEQLVPIDLVIGTPGPALAGQIGRCLKLPEGLAPVH